jgi:hypothetical protein
LGGPYFQHGILLRWKEIDEKKPAHCAGFFVLAEQAGFEPAVGY